MTPPHAPGQAPPAEALRISGNSGAKRPRKHRICIPKLALQAWDLCPRKHGIWLSMPTCQGTLEPYAPLFLREAMTGHRRPLESVRAWGRLSSCLRCGERPQAIVGPQRAASRLSGRQPPAPGVLPHPVLYCPTVCISTQMQTIINEPFSRP